MLYVDIIFLISMGYYGVYITEIGVKHYCFAYISPLVSLVTSLRYPLTIGRFYMSQIIVVSSQFKSGGVSFCSRVCSGCGCDHSNLYVVANPIGDPYVVPI